MTLSCLRWNRALLLILCLGTLLQAADTPPKAFLGVTINVAGTAFNGKGLAVERVEPRSPAAVMGVTGGDRILSINGTALVTQDDLAKVMTTRKPGATIKLEIQREKGKDGLPEILTLSGVLLEAPKSKSASLAQQLADNAERLAAIEKAKGPSLGEVLQKIQDIEKDLPRAAEEFKKTYPNGEFKISISVEITSDKTAKDPLTIDVGGKPTPVEAPKKPEDKK